MMGMFGARGRSAVASADPADLSSAYNTPLAPHEEAAFQQWRAALTPNLQSVQDYDLRGAWKANAQEAANGHLPDTWKKPNHPTFSSGSQYSGQGDDHGGEWVQRPDGKWMFYATPANLKYRDTGDLQAYFQQREPGNRMVQPGQSLLSPEMLARLARR